jgi:recombination protein RecA
MFMSQFDELQAFLANARSNARDGSARALAAAPVMSLDDMRAQQLESHREAWGLSSMRGRLVEISGRGATAILTTAVGIVLEAQLASEPVVWVTLASATFYPPDMAASGVDLAALVVVRVVDSTAAMSAAERVLRSGAIGLVVIDLGCAAAAAAAASRESASSSGEPVRADRRSVSVERGYQRRAAMRSARDGTSNATATHARLIALAQQHDAAVVCLTEKSADSPSLGSLVSLRAEATRLLQGDYRANIRVMKDKRRGPGFESSDIVTVPSGMK